MYRFVFIPVPQSKAVLCPGRFSKTVKERLNRGMNPPSGHWSGIMFRQCLSALQDLNASVCLLLLALSSTDFIVKMVLGFFLFHFGMTSGLPAHLFSYAVRFTNLHCWLIFKHFLSLLLFLCCYIHLEKKINS